MFITVFITVVFTAALFVWPWVFYATGKFSPIHTRTHATCSLVAVTNAPAHRWCSIDGLLRRPKDGTVDCSGTKIKPPAIHSPDSRWGYLLCQCLQLRAWGSVELWFKSWACSKCHTVCWTEEKNCFERHNTYSIYTTLEASQPSGYNMRRTDSFHLRIPEKKAFHLLLCLGQQWRPCWSWWPATEDCSALIGQV